MRPYAGFGARVIGVEVDPERLTRIQERLTATGTEAEVIQGDFTEVNTSSADVIAIYLSASMNAKLAPKLRNELKAGARIASLDYVLPGWVPEREFNCQKAAAFHPKFTCTGSPETFAHHDRYEDVYTTYLEISCSL